MRDRDAICARSVTTITDAPRKVSQVVDFSELVGFKDYVVVAVSVEFGETRMHQGFLGGVRRRLSEIAALKSGGTSLNSPIAANIYSIFAEVVCVARMKLIQLHLQSDYEG